MLIGEYRHSIDGKKRMSLPAKFRKVLGKKVVITKGLDKCLFIYSEKEWKMFIEKLKNLPLGNRDSRKFARLLLSGAAEVSPDSIGRVLLSDFHKDFAELKDEAVVIGVHNRVEVWSPELWDKYKKDMESEAEYLADKLGDLGMI